MEDRQIWFIAATILILLSPVAIGLRRAGLLLAASVALVALSTYSEGGMPGCFVLFQCVTDKPYSGLISSVIAGFVLLVYLGVALAAPIILLLRRLMRIARR